MIWGKAVKISSLFALILLISVMLAPIAFANSAEPPGLMVVVSFPSDDLSLSIRFSDGSVANPVQLQKEQKAWESYYRFYYGMVSSTRPSLAGATLIVESSKNSFELVLPESVFGQYNNLITLDVDNQTITEGQSLGRLILLVSIRVALTLLIEGMIFFAFGYRQKRSWIAFFVVNLITQSALNALLSGPNLSPYLVFFGFAFIELVIFAAEMIAFPIVLKEHRKRRALLYAFIANFVSLILGGMWIANLPV